MFVAALFKKKERKQKKRTEIKEERKGKRKRSNLIIQKLKHGYLNNCKPHNGIK